MDRVAIGSRLKEARNKAHLTQEQLSEKVGIGTTYLSDIERGAKFPSLSLFINLVDALGYALEICQNLFALFPSLWYHETVVPYPQKGGLVYGRDSVSLASYFRSACI